MGHYDWVYEEYVKTKVKEDIKNLNTRIRISEEEKESITSAIEMTEDTLPYATKVLKQLSKEKDHEIRTYKKSKDRLEHVIERMNDGETFSYDQVHSIARGNMW